MFGTLLIILFIYLAQLWRVNRGKSSLIRWIVVAGGITLGLMGLGLFFGVIIASLPLLGDLYVQSLGGAESISNLVLESLNRRLNNLGWVSLIVLFGLSLGLITSMIRARQGSPRESAEERDYQGGNSSNGNIISEFHSHQFVSLMIIVGVLLVIFTEFFYLRDQFGTRMNTIFKFYYQAWLLWGIAAAFGSVYLLQELKNFAGLAFRLVFGFVLVAALIYPILGLWTKTGGFSPPGGYTLNGAAYLQNASPDEIAGIQWLQNAQPGVVLEAVGPQYSEYARVATHSGLPTVLGWPGHESQWRGGGSEMGNRQADIELIYRTNNWETAKTYLDLYNVRYVFVGDLERNTYPVSEGKFVQFLDPVFNQGQVTIYEVPRN
jgi:hypothetical protein